MTIVKYSNEVIPKTWSFLSVFSPSLQCKFTNVVVMHLKAYYCKTSVSGLICLHPSHSALLLNPNAQKLFQIQMFLLSHFCANVCLVFVSPWAYNSYVWSSVRCLYSMISMSSDTVRIWKKHSLVSLFVSSG